MEMFETPRFFPLGHIGASGIFSCGEIENCLKKFNTTLADAVVIRSQYANVLCEKTAFIENMARSFRGDSA